MSSWLELVKHSFVWANSYVQLPMGLAGFGFAFYQIHQARVQISQAKSAAESAKTAAEAAAEAAENARGQFKSMSVTVLLPQLRNLEDSVDRAIHDRSLILLMHLLQDWRWHASACREYLDGSVGAEAEVMKGIQKSVIAASNLKHKFPDFNDTTDWAKETSQLRKAMADVTANLGALSAQQTVRGA